MLNKLRTSILSLSLLVAILTGCGAGGGDVQTSNKWVGQTTGDGQARLLSISVTPSGSQIAQSTVQQFTATGIYSDNTTQDLTGSVTWSSSDTSVLVVADSAARAVELASQSTMMAPSSGGGHAFGYGKKSGTTTVTATSGDATGSTTVTVTTATLVSLAITPVNPSIANGTAQQFTAMGTFSDNTTQDMTLSVIWSSSNTAVAQISNTGSNGLATGVGAGTTVINAVSGSVSGSDSLTVTTVAATGSATLAWNAPTTNTDGTPLTDLAGYKIHYGTSSGNYTSVIDVGNVTTYTAANLSSGTYYFVVTSYDSSNIESTYSNEASKTIQ